ncbi:MAG: glutaredoxin, partial [Myxococcales bacterium]|nr:glutaredoxin [Myxococcales bacterium]
MSRSVLSEDQIHPNARAKVTNNHADIVAEVQAAVAKHDVVVVGMAQNPHCKRARKVLNAKGVAFEYLEYGSYTSQWRRRTAIKMWSGWPTFPMVFV